MITIFEIKKQIFERKNTPIIEQYLSYNGKPLSDECSLQSYNILPDYTINCNIRIKGGKNEIFKILDTVNETVSIIEILEKDCNLTSIKEIISRKTNVPEINLSFYCTFDEISEMGIENSKKRTFEEISIRKEVIFLFKNNKTDLERDPQNLTRLFST